MKNNGIKLFVVRLTSILFSFTILLSAQVKNLPSVEGINGLVSTAHPLASEAALDVLKAGGNAVDAAVAAAFAIGVVEPDGSGLGGGGCMLIYIKEKNKAYYINYYQQASEKIFDVDYKRSEGITAKTILVPGNVAGLTTALEEFGTRPIAEIIEPAIKYAEEGFPIDLTLAGIILDNISVIDKYKLTKEIYMPSDFPLMEGDILKQPELANTLKIIGQKGAMGFYEGEVAEKIVNGITSEGGAITLNDMKTYKAQLTEPLRGTYRNYEIISAGLPQSGVSLIETMNMLELIDFGSMGHFTESAEVLHLMAEVFLKSYSDRYSYTGDPRFSEIPIEGLLAKEYAVNRFNEINRDQTAPEGYRETPPGNPWNTQSINRCSENAETESSGHTTHISIVDKEGNMVSLTQTLGTFFGSGYTAAGVLFNSSRINYSSRIEANKMEPGKISRSTIAPTFLLKEDKPFLCLGTPGGGRIISTLAEIIVNIVDFGMSAESANQAPRFHCQVNDDYLSLENRFSEDVIKVLESKGHNLKIYEEFDLFFGGAQLIIIDPETGKYYGTADKRRGGVALGY